VNDALAMRVGKALGNLSGDVECFVDRQCTSLETLTQRETLQEFAHDERMPIGCADFINRHYAGMVQC
jgi:hypothetical protein